MDKHKRRRKRLIIAGSVCLIIFGVGAIGLAALSIPAVSASFADNILRPLIGDKGVIAFEGAVFGAQDKFNHITNKQPAHSSYVPYVRTAAVAAAKTAAMMALPNPAPANLTPYVDLTHPLAGEGVWQSIVGTSLYTTFIRTDSDRPYATVNLVYIPTQNVGIGAVAGTKYPGGSPGPGMVPAAVQNSGKLIAAFNGGFQEKDGHYGMYANGITYVPLRIDLATLQIFGSGQVSLGNYNGQTLAADVVAARQNGPLLVENGQDNQLTSQGISLWAGTANGDYITWRSGLGEKVNGDLIYAVGPSLTPTSLADALRLAGSQNAMQLDINNFWVRFMIYSWNSQSQNYTWSTLIKGLADGGSDYLHGYQKDFFYLYSK